MEGLGEFEKEIASIADRIYNIRKTLMSYHQLKLGFWDTENSFRRIFCTENIANFLVIQN